MACVHTDLWCEPAFDTELVAVHVTAVTGPGSAFSSKGAVTSASHCRAYHRA